MSANGGPRSGDVRVRLAALARVGTETPEVVSVYVNTRWTDEHQRDRARLFLKGAIGHARVGAAAGVRADLAWVEAQGERLIAQSERPDAAGVAMFACARLELREVIAVRRSVPDALVVAERPALAVLAAVIDDMPSIAIAFVDGESARLVPVDAGGPGAETTLAHEVPGRHRQGGWALLSQSRYQRHTEEQRARHFAAVAEALGRLVEARGAERIVLAGEARAAAVFRAHLPPALLTRVVGVVAASRHEPASALVERAPELVERVERSEEAARLEGVLVEAAKKGRAVAGVDETLDAVSRGAVQRLYIARDLDGPATVCAGCAVLAPGAGGRCPRCGGTARPIRLADVLVARVLADGGAVDVLDGDARLAGVGGVAAALRFPL